MPQGGTPNNLLQMLLLTVVDFVAGIVDVRRSARTMKGNKEGIMMVAQRISASRMAPTNCGEINIIKRNNNSIAAGIP